MIKIHQTMVINMQNMLYITLIMSTQTTDPAFIAGSGNKGMGIYEP
jgi:hypothetical protein